MMNAKRCTNRQLSFAGFNRAFERTIASEPRLLIWLVTILFLVCPLAVHAQQLTATLSGMVTDSSGAVIPNSTVTVTQTSTNAVRTVQSDASGSYVVTSLPAGTYTVNVASSGFETWVARNVVLNVAEKRGLVGELVVHRTPGDARDRGDLRRPHLRVAAQAPQLAGSRDQRVAGRRGALLLGPSLDFHTTCW